MARRIALLFLFAALLVSIPAAASQPNGLAGEIITGAQRLDPGCFGAFEWLAGGYEMPLGPTDTLTLEMAIVPFTSGVTAIGIDFGPYYTTAVPLNFTDGSVAGVPYIRNAWNDVVVQVASGRQEFEVTVNGVRSGPIHFLSDCGGVCTSVGNFRINGGSNEAGGSAWVDSISLVRHGADGDELYYEFTADPCFPYPYVNGGGLVLLEPPRRLRSPK